jgi:hypothetical protein
MSDPNRKSAQNGKGDAPKNNFSQVYRSNYEAINWKNNATKKPKHNQCPKIRGN